MSVRENDRAPGKFGTMVDKMYPIGLVLMAARATMVFTPTPMCYLRRDDGGAEERVAESQGFRVPRSTCWPETGFGVASVL